MELALFDFIDETIKEYEKQQPMYQQAKQELTDGLAQLMDYVQVPIVSLQSRIKKSASLREKLIRNEYYMLYPSGQEALDHVHDLIGIIIQCRFIKDEQAIYQALFPYFQKEQQGIYRCVCISKMTLNLDIVQPQKQRNGFTIYRIDGTYETSHGRINFELQIKSLVHAFWSEIEHELIYKNPDFIMFDTFHIDMLAAIRDNLDTVDRQLEVMSQTIANQSKRSQIGIDEISFKTFITTNINELVNRKMKESVGFATDFKKCSAIIAQFIYIHDFVSGHQNQVKMLDYLQTLAYLGSTPIDLKQEIVFDQPYSSIDPFCQCFGEGLLSKMNVDFNWHVFFVMLFCIHGGDIAQDYRDFIQVIRILLVQPTWYEQTFERFSSENAMKVKVYFLECLAKGLLQVGSIEVIHEDKLFHCMNTFKSLIEQYQKEYASFHQMENALEDLGQQLIDQIGKHFEK